jgi:DNA-binding IclR family transcriptional regulator
MHLDQLASWQRRAALALADLQGRTPPLLQAVLVEWPMVTTGLAQQLTGASKAAVLRNLDRMQARGLLREVTGQGRYQVWTVVL